MCNRARIDSEPETLREKFGAKWLADVPNKWPIEMTPRSGVPVIRSEGAQRIIDLMSWDVLGGQAPWPMTNVRNLTVPQWRRLAERPENRCLIPCTEFCEWTPGKHDLGDGKVPVKGEMWFRATDQAMFAVAGFWQRTVKGSGFTMVTGDPNELVAPIHPKAMVTILRSEDQQRWLECPLEDVLRLQSPYPAELMTKRGPMFPTRRNER